MPEEIKALLQKNYEQLKSSCSNYGELRKKIERQYKEDSFTDRAYADLQLQFNVGELEKELSNLPLR